MRKTLLGVAIGLASCSPHSSCLARGTRVWTPDGWREIQSLGVGDSIYAVREATGELVATVVTDSRSAMREVGMVTVGTSRLAMTADHPVYCPETKSYAPAGDWFLGRRTALAVVTGDGLEVQSVTSSQAFVAVMEVFDISVEDPLHNFIGEGIVVHNKSPHTECTFEGEVVDIDSVCECRDGRSGFIECPSTTAYCNCLAGGRVDDGHDGAEPVLRQRGECASDDECVSGGACVGVGSESEGAYFTCRVSLGAAPGCEAPDGSDECCVHEDCTDGFGGACVQNSVFHCGAPTQSANECVYAECAGDADCGDRQMCIEAGLFGESGARCVTANCRLDKDCDERDGGQCEAFFDPCNDRFDGFYCTYVDSACRSNMDCPGPTDSAAAAACVVKQDGETECVEFSPPP